MGTTIRSARSGVMGSGTWGVGCGWGVGFAIKCCSGLEVWSHAQLQACFAYRQVGYEGSGRDKYCDIRSISNCCCVCCY